VSRPTFGVIEIFFTRPKEFHDICCRTDEKFVQTGRLHAWGLLLRFGGFNVGLQAGSQCASGWSCGRPLGSSCYVVFFGPRAHAYLVPKWTLLSMLLAQPSRNELQNLGPNAALTLLPKFRHTANTKLITNFEPLPSAAQPQQLASHHLTLCTLQFFTWFSRASARSPSGLWLRLQISRRCCSLTKFLAMFVHE
jgi:hypothetical protein